MTARSGAPGGRKNMKPLKQGLGILLLCWATYVTAYLCRVNISAALTKMSAGLGVSMEYLGMASSIYFITYAAGQLLNGFLGDRVRPYRFLLTAVAAAGAANLAVGTVSNGASFLLIWGLNGYIQSMFWGSLLRLLSFHIPAEHHKTVSTVMSTASVTGYILSWSILGKAFAGLSWKAYFIAPGFCALLLIPCWLLTARRHPMEQMLRERQETPPVGRAVRELFEDRMYFICLLCCAIGAIQEGAVFWLPVIFSRDLGLNADSSLLLLMVIPFSKLLGVFLARWLLGRHRENARRSMLAMLALVSAIAVLLVLTSRLSALLTVLLIGLLILAVNGSNWIIISYLPLSFAERNMVSTLVGILDFSIYVGAAVSSPLTGIVLALYGWPAVPVIWLGLTAVSVLLALTGAGGCLLRKGKRIHECT